MQTHCFDNQLMQLSFTCVSSPFFCSHLVILSIPSCFLLSSVSCMQRFTSTQVSLVSNRKIVFCSLFNLHSPLSCCIIYMFVIILPLSPRGTRFSQILFIFPCDSGKRRIPGVVTQILIDCGMESYKG